MFLISFSRLSCRPSSPLESYVVGCLRQKSSEPGWARRHAAMATCPLCLWQRRLFEALRLLLAPKTALKVQRNAMVLQCWCRCSGGWRTVPEAMLEMLHTGDRLKRIAESAAIDLGPQGTSQDFNRSKTEGGTLVIQAWRGTSRCAHRAQGPVPWTHFIQTKSQSLLCEDLRHRLGVPDTTWRGAFRKRKNCR